MTERRPYPSDLSDARWALVEPVLTAWRDQRRGQGLDIGRPPEHDLRAILDAILYIDRTGIPWRCLPHEYLSVTWNHAPQEPSRILRRPHGLRRRIGQRSGAGGEMAGPWPA
jgi:transposase